MAFSMYGPSMVASSMNFIPCSLMERRTEVAGQSPSRYEYDCYLILTVVISQISRTDEMSAFDSRRTKVQ